MTRRPPSAPPQLPGYEFEKLLGSGGFADVFLYRQLRPQRRVAIKVLLASILDDAVRQQFDAEANVMATMSTHPSIVTIYQADVSADQRPYIVMEHCSRPNYGVRFRRERIAVDEALRVGIQIAGAVETAHRAGILHRDIKPANILVTDYNRPALTDFGISVVAGQAQDLDDSQGMSIPWSPPEVFADQPRADVRSDVFSLAATIYSLLASSTPFERAGERNTAADLIHRIETEPLRPLPRPDVPPELNRVLSTAMAKNPAGRYDSALAFGRALQQVEMSLALTVTPMDVLDEHGAGTAAGGDDDDLDAHTRIRRVATVDAQSAPSQAPSQAPRLDSLAGVAPALGSHGPVPGAPARTGGSWQAASTTGSAGEATVLRPAGAPVPAGRPGTAPALPASEDDEPEHARRGGSTWLFITLAALVIIGLGVGSTVAVRHYLVAEPPSPPKTTFGPTRSGEAPDRPVTVTVDVFTQAVPGESLAKSQIKWEHAPGTTEGTAYSVRWSRLPEDLQSEYGQWHDVHGRVSVVMDVPPGITAPCVEVRAFNDHGSSTSQQACVASAKKKGA